MNAAAPKPPRPASNPPPASRDSDFLLHVRETQTWQEQMELRFKRLHDEVLDNRHRIDALFKKLDDDNVEVRFCESLEALKMPFWIFGGVWTVLLSALLAIQVLK